MGTAYRHLALLAATRGNQPSRMPTTACCRRFAKWWQRCSRPSPFVSTSQTARMRPRRARHSRVCRSADLPASYANFYIANTAALVPTFADPNDARAVATVQAAFPNRRVVAIDCRELVWGLGALSLPDAAATAIKRGLRLYSFPSAFRHSRPIAIRFGASASLFMSMFKANGYDFASRSIHPTHQPICRPPVSGQYHPVLACSS